LYNIGIMVKAPESYGALSPEQAAQVFIDPIAANVTDSQGNFLGGVNVTAPVANVTSRFGAELAARETVYGEIGPGTVRVSGSLIDEIIAAGLAKALAIKETEVEELSTAEFQADLEANSLAVDFPEDGTDQVVPTPNDYTVRFIDGEVTDSVDILESDTSDTSSERAVQLFTGLGEVAVAFVDLDVEADEEFDTARAELGDRVPGQPETLGRLILSETIMLVDILEHAEGAAYAEVDEYGSYEETAAGGYLRIESEGLQELSTVAALGMLGVLGELNTTGTEVETGGEDRLTELDNITAEDLAFMSLAAYELRPEQETEYVLAA
jgi:hypothetical protein